MGKGFTAYNRLRVGLSTIGLATLAEPYILRSQNQEFISHYVRKNTSIYDEIVRKYQERNDVPGLAW